MEFLADLWLPIVLSAAFVFVASSVVHMLLPFHRGDAGKLPAEEEILAALRERGVEPGAYMFPCPGSMREMSSPEMIARYEQGPVGFLTVRPNGVPAIGKSLLQWFVYSLLVSIFVAYIAAVTLGSDADPGFRMVFRVTGTVAILAYAVAQIPESIWKGQAWKITAKFLLDGVIYGVVTALAFAWLW